MRCSTCNIEVKAGENYVIFDCPNCGNFTIVRCHSCKANGRKYACPKCGFVGP